LIIYITCQLSEFATFDFFPDKRFNVRSPLQGQSRTTGYTPPSNDLASPSMRVRECKILLSRWCKSIRVPFMKFAIRLSPSNHEIGIQGVSEIVL